MQKRKSNILLFIVLLNLAVSEPSAATDIHIELIYSEKVIQNFASDSIITSVILSADSCDKESEEKIGDADIEKGRFSFTGFPVILYMPETSAIFGGGSVMTFRNGEHDDGDRPNSISSFGIYTLKNQLTVSVEPDFYFSNYKWRVMAVLSYQKFPDSFYGIGSDVTGEKSEDYSTSDYFLFFSATRSIYKSFRVGFWYKLKKTDVLFVESNGLIVKENLLGINGSLLSGFGPAIDWDMRDNIFYPTKGFWLQFSWGLYRNWIGSDFEYNSYHLDYRQYFTLTENHILALQFVAKSATGDIPFNEYMRLESMRGINGSIYKDNKMFFGQVEYRYPVYGRFSGVAFAAIGDVTDLYKNIRFSGLKYCFGFGLRYMLNPDEKINFRFDVGFSPWGVSPYFQISEAF